MSTTDIAVIGEAYRFNGVRTADELFDALCGKKVLKTRIKAPNIFDQSASYVPYRSMLDDIQLFDAEAFGIDSEGAAILDPQIRILLECAWECLESAGWSVSENTPRNISVFTTASLSSYLLNNLLNNAEALSKHSHIELLDRNDRNVISSMISKIFGLHGESMSVQNGSTSFLQCVCLACDSIISGRCNAAIAGGASVCVPQKAGYVYHEGGPLSGTGKNNVFGNDCDGLIPASGAGMFLLKRLDDALADNDNILAVIKGYSCGYAADRKGRKELIHDAYRAADVAPTDISYAEITGTGIMAKDIEEIRCLSEVFTEEGAAGSSCCLGSVSANTGYAGEASGIAAMGKLVHMLRNRVLIPQAEYTIPFDGFPYDGAFYINDSAEAVEKAEGCMCLNHVSEYGNNIHIILAEAPATDTETEVQDNGYVLLSAGSKVSLMALRDQYIRAIELDPDMNAADIAYTTQISRSQYRFRACIKAGDIKELHSGLQDIDIKEFSDCPYYQPDENADIEELIDKWNEGYNIDWSAYYKNRKHGRKIRLPLYQFDRKQFWYEAAEPGAASVVSFEKSTESSDPPAEKTAKTLYERPDLFTEYVAPESEIEQELCAIWSDHLGIRNVGVNDNFMELGGNSIIGTQILNRIQQKYPIDIQISTFIKMPTVAQQAEFIDEELEKIINGMDSDFSFM